MSDVTQQMTKPDPLSDLNDQLIEINTAIREQQRDGQTIYRLCKLVPLTEIDDITSFVALYGVNWK